MARRLQWLIDQARMYVVLPGMPYYPGQRQHILTNMTTRHSTAFLGLMGPPRARLREWPDEATRTWTKDSVLPPEQFLSVKRMLLSHDINELDFVLNQDNTRPEPPFW